MQLNTLLLPRVHERGAQPHVGATMLALQRNRTCSQAALQVCSLLFFLLFSCLSRCDECVTASDRPTAAVVPVAVATQCWGPSTSYPASPTRLPATRVMQAQLPDTSQRIHGSLQACPLFVFFAARDSQRALRAESLCVCDGMCAACAAATDACCRQHCGAHGSADTVSLWDS